MIMSFEQAKAILFGLALGDAIGWPTEFLSLPQIYSRFGAKGIQEPRNPALYTDDTQMTIALTEGLLEAGLGASIDSQMEAVAKRFITWKNSPENNRAPGNTCMAAVRRLESGMAWRDAGIKDSKGCGSAMRVATIGYLYQNDETKLREVAKESGIITHGHSSAVAGSIAAAYLMKLALDGIAPEEYLRRTLAFCEGISEDFDKALIRVTHVMGWGSETHAMRHLGEGWVGDEAVALALYCVLRYPNDYAEAVRRGATSEGDSDSIACIAGGIMGARLGLDAIPLDWRERCENKTYLIDLAKRMAEAKEAYNAR
jgi:ADP-ribosylglycohydrolase